MGASLLSGNDMFSVCYMSFVICDNTVSFSQVP